MAETSTVLAISLTCALVAVTILGFTGVIPTPPMTGTCAFPDMVCRWGKMFGIPDFFLSNRNFIFYFLMPLGALGTIIYGFLSTLRLFGSTRVTVLLSIFITLICVPTQVISMLAATLLTILGTWAVGAFVVVFGLGIFLVSKGTLYNIRGTYGVFEADMSKKIAEMNRKIAELRDPNYLRRNHINPVDAAEEIRRLDERRAKYHVERQHLQRIRRNEY